MLRVAMALIGLTAAIAAPAAAEVVRVTASGTVAFNQIATGPLAGIAPGTPAALTFDVDSTVFTNSATFPVRGYAITPSSLSLVLGATTVALQSPLPVGQTPYFVVRNNDPAVDGFYLSTSVDGPNGVPTNQVLGTSNLRLTYLVTYTGTTLSSLDILGAVGTYGFNGLTNFNWLLQSGPFEPFGIDFEEMTIAVVGCYADCNLSGGLTIADFACFQAAFAANDPYADCNQSGGLTIADFGCFQSAFASGCP